MPNYCSVISCSSYSDNKNCKNIRFFCFPKDTSVRANWVKACGNKKVNVEYARICSLHFSEDDYCLKHKLLNEPLLKRKLDPKAIPSKNLPECWGDSATSNYCIENFEICILQDTKNPETDIQHQENLHQAVEFANSIGTQTEAITLECSRDDRVMELEKRLQLCQKEKKQLEEKYEKLRNLESSLKCIFTDGQIKRLQNPKKKLNWTSDDISSAISLHSAGPRAYRYLCKKNYPLPGPSTLRQWASRIKIKPCNQAKSEDEI